MPVTYRAREGETHGTLTVIAYAGREGTSRHTLWVCACSACGGRVTLRSTRLARGHCGCLGYRRDGHRHRVAREKVAAERRAAISRLGGNALALARLDNQDDNVLTSGNSD